MRAYGARINKYTTIEEEECACVRTKCVAKFCETSSHAQKRGV